MFEKSHVYRSKYLIEVYDVAINVAANARDDLNRSEYAKIAAFSLYRAKIALDNCGVKYVKYPDYAMIARSTKKMGCKEVTWPKDKEQIYIDQIYKCLEKGYENVLENYRIANQDVDIPVFGNRIIKEIK